MSVPQILKNTETEPEAAHLRAVVTRVRLVADEALAGSVDLGDALELIRGICTEAERRPRTNGKVIDALTRENGDLQSKIIDLQRKIDEMKKQIAVLGMTAPGGE